MENVPGGRGKNTPWPWENSRGGRTEILKKYFQKVFEKIIYKINLENVLRNCGAVAACNMAVAVGKRNGRTGKNYFIL